ncbi:MAG TPA: type I-D CRISPR-associated protein Cas7/Csc2 [Ktedonobacteraceae bacterium]|nr:type I-D CRISPR-associated protein Cas7/Csc2 [Ktedonobacteraceae bacterium]
MATTSNLSIFNQYSEYLLPTYSRFPKGRYASLLVIRKTESETIFRTEGSGEGLTKDTVIAGINANNRKPIRRVVISKRKQTAVERRTGRELLREHNLLKTAIVNKKEYECTLNANAPCGECIDCMLYGYAVGGGGAQKSRVMTDDAYSILQASEVTGHRTFNAPSDNGIMWNPIKNEASKSINDDEYVLPETHFLDMETLKDVTPGELQYVIGNVFRSSRYGAISSRLGKMQNSLAAIIFSDTELFSNLELTQQVYDLLPRNEGNIEVPLFDEPVFEAVQKATNLLLERVVGRTPLVVREKALQQVLDDTITLYRDRDSVKSFLQDIEKGYPSKSK